MEFEWHANKAMSNKAMSNKAMSNKAMSNKAMSNKAMSNEQKHGVPFSEASSCFWDPFQVAFYDPDHGEDENREILIAHSNRGRLLVVIYTMRGDAVRLISARLATRKEARDHAEGI